MYYSASTGGFYDPRIHETMPNDVVKITTEEYAALLAGQSIGQVIAPSDGRPLLVTQPLKPVTVTGLCYQIDTAADAARRAVAGDPLRAVEYDRSASEAQAFKDAGYPSGAVPRAVSAWAINGRTPRQAADSILAEAAAYTEALYCIRETRLQAKELIRTAVNAGNIERAQDIADETVAYIENAVAGIGNNAGT